MKRKLKRLRKRPASLTVNGTTIKIVYVHNYSDMDDNVKEDDPISHGAHVAGTAVGTLLNLLQMVKLSVVLLQKPN